MNSATRRKHEGPALPSGFAAVDVPEAATWELLSKLRVFFHDADPHSMRKMQKAEEARGTVLGLTTKGSFFARTGKADLKVQLPGPAQAVFTAANNLIRAWAPPFFIWTPVQLWHQSISGPHKDGSNLGPSYALSLGDFISGRVKYTEGSWFSTRNRLRP